MLGTKINLMWNIILHAKIKAKTILNKTELCELGVDEDLDRIQETIKIINWVHQNSFFLLCLKRYC